MMNTNIEEMLEIACNECGGNCESCTMRKECEAFQSQPKEIEIKPETLRAGMIFEGVANWNAGDCVRIKSIIGNRVYTDNYGDCDREYFPAIQYPDEWKYIQDEAKASDNAYAIEF